jgi:hypothetical protein
VTVNVTANVTVNVTVNVTPRLRVGTGRPPYASMRANANVAAIRRVGRAAIGPCAHAE